MHTSVLSDHTQDNCLKVLNIVLLKWVLRFDGFFVFKLFLELRKCLLKPGTTVQHIRWVDKLTVN